MSRPKPLSKTKQLRRQLKDVQAKLNQVETIRRLDNASSQAAISTLETRLKRLVGTRFEYSAQEQTYTAQIKINERLLHQSYHSAAYLEDALFQLFNKIHKYAARCFLPNHKELLERLRRSAQAEFDDMLYPLIRQIAKEHPSSEPPISIHTLFGLARRFLDAFIQMASEPHQEPAWPNATMPLLKRPKL